MPRPEACNRAASATDYHRPAHLQLPALAQARLDVAGIGRLASSIERHEGGVLSRALGSAVHSLLEELARLRATSDWPFARGLLLERMRPRITRQLRGGGRGSEAGRKNRRPGDGHCHQGYARCRMRNGFLSPHADAASEVRWAGIIAGSLHEVRVDRVFRAGGAAWRGRRRLLVDHRLQDRHEDRTDRRRLCQASRALFASQLELYAQVLRNLHGTERGDPRRALLSAHAGVRLVGVVSWGWSDVCISRHPNRRSFARSG